MSTLKELFNPAAQKAIELKHDLGKLRSDRLLIYAKCKKCNQVATIRIKDHLIFGGALDVECAGKDNSQLNEFELKGTVTGTTRSNSIKEDEMASKKKKLAAKKTSAPKKQGVLKKVWDICSKMMKASRKEQIAACIKAGINKGTASITVSQFRKAKGLVKK